MRERGERVPGHRLAVVVEALERREEGRDAIARGEVADPPRTEPDGRYPGPQVADEEVRQARVGGQDPRYGDDLLASVDDLDRRQPQALLEEVGGLGRDRAGRHATDVVPVGDRGRPGDQSLLDEHGHREHDVVEVGDAAVERVVGREDVAGARLQMQFEHAPHRLVEHTDE